MHRPGCLVLETVYLIPWRDSRSWNAKIYIDSENELECRFCTVGEGGEEMTTYEVETICEVV
jgi:hypothetical protein